MLGLWFTSEHLVILSANPQILFAKPAKKLLQSCIHDRNPVEAGMWFFRFCGRRRRFNIASSYGDLMTSARTCASRGQSFAINVLVPIDHLEARTFNVPAFNFSQGRRAAPPPPNARRPNSRGGGGRRRRRWKAMSPFDHATDHVADQDPLGCWMRLHVLRIAQIACLEHCDCMPGV